MRLLLSLAAKVLLAQLLVMAVVGPMGFAMAGRQGLSWTTSGAAVWTLLFALAAIWLRRSVLGWSVAGGLICGAAWSFGYLIAEYLTALTYSGYDYRWAGLFGAFGGLGAGLMGGAADSAVHEPAFRRAIRLGAWAAAVSWGGLCGGAAPFMTAGIGTAPQASLWGAVAILCALPTMPLGWRIGALLSPIVVFFEELGPYLAEMTRPLGAFAAGFLTLTVVFAGLYGTFWRLDGSGSFHNLPASPNIWDFAEFSLMTATTGNTAIEPASGPTRLLSGLEVVLGTGWLIVVFGALSVHLAPRLEEIATRLHRRSPRPVGESVEPPAETASTEASSSKD